MTVWSTPKVDATSLCGMPTSFVRVATERGRTVVKGWGRAGRTSRGIAAERPVVVPHVTGVTPRHEVVQKPVALADVRRARLTARPGGSMSTATRPSASVAARLRTRRYALPLVAALGTGLLTGSAVSPAAAMTGDHGTGPSTSV